MISFLSQMFKATENAVVTDLPSTDEMGLGRLAQMKAHAHAHAQDGSGAAPDLLSRVKSAELGDSAKQLRFRKPEVKTPLYGGWDSFRHA